MRKASRRGLAITTLFSGLLLVSIPAYADEPLFGYVYTTDLLPKDKVEVTQWGTWRAGKATGDFDVLEGRTEFEYGASDRLQVAGYLNYEWARAYHDNVITGTTLPPATLANLNVGPDEHLNTGRFTGVSVEGIYRVFSPYTDPVGLAVYLRPTVGSQFQELESRLILQKNYLDDLLVTALNVTVTDDRRYISTTTDPLDSSIIDRAWNQQSTIAYGLATSYRFARSLSAGLELQNERGYNSLNPFGSGKKTNVAYYFGPSIHYADQHLFCTLTYLDQLPFASDYAHSNPDYIVDGRNYAANFERLRVRLRFGWYF